MIRFLFSVMFVLAMCVPAVGQDKDSGPNPFLITELPAAVTPVSTTSESAVPDSTGSVPAEYQDEVAEATSSFHSQVITIARKMVRDHKLKRTELISLRVAMLSPAFRAHAETLAVVQISASGVESISAPIGDNGQIDRATIDWDALGSFLEKLIPLIIMLLNAFGGTSAG